MPPSKSARFIAAQSFQFQRQLYVAGEPVPADVAGAVGSPFAGPAPEPAPVEPPEPPVVQTPPPPPNARALKLLAGTVPEVAKVVDGITDAAILREMLETETAVPKDARKGVVAALEARLASLSGSTG